MLVGCEQKDPIARRTTTQPASLSASEPRPATLLTADQPLDRVDLNQVPARARWRYLAEFPTQQPAGVFRLERDGKSFFVFQVQTSAGLWYEAYVREDGRKPAETRTFDTAPPLPTTASIPSVD